MSIFCLLQTLIILLSSSAFASLSSEQVPKRNVIEGMIGRFGPESWSVWTVLKIKDEKTERRPPTPKRLEQLTFDFEWNKPQPEIEMISVHSDEDFQQDNDIPRNIQPTNYTENSRQISLKRKAEVAVQKVRPSEKKSRANSYVAPAEVITLPSFEELIGSFRRTD